MEIQALIKHSFLVALQAVAKDGNHLQPFSYVFRYGEANILGKDNMPHEQAIEHLKNITRPMDGLSEYSIVWEAIYQEHQRAIVEVHGGSETEGDLLR